MLERLGRTCFRRRRTVVAAWIVGVIALTTAAGALGGELRTDFSLPGSESQAASDLLDSAGFTGGGDRGQLVVHADGGVDGPAVRGVVDSLSSSIADLDGVHVVSPWDPGGPGQVSADGTVAFADLRFGALSFEEASERADRIVELRDGTAVPDGVSLELGGELFAEEAEFSSEGIGFLAAIIILLLAFGSVIAMGLPIGIALVGILGAVGLVSFAALVLDVPEFAPATVAMVTIGVGIDYALFIVTRYREELAAGSEPLEAVGRALGTAGRAVLFAGSTVVVALMGLVVVGLPSTRSLAVAVSAGVLAVLLATLTLLPALLGFVGRGIDRLSVLRPNLDPVGSNSRWYRWARAVQRRPLLVGGVALVVLLGLTAPVLSMRLGFSDSSNRPTTDTSRRAHDLLTDGFGPGVNGPLVLAVDLGSQPTDGPLLTELSDAVTATPEVAAVTPPVVDHTRGVAFLQAFPRTGPQDEATAEVVHSLRDDVLPAALAGSDAAVLVGGPVAAATDFAELQRDRMPWFVAAVLALSFVVLLAVFRSVAVAATAVVLNLLSIGAAWGVLVAVFQWGWGTGLLGVGEPGPVEAWVPMMLFAIVFGLSMDYEVFLLSRIREEHDHGADNSTAVAHGLARTARLITAAAGIMIFVFGAFVLSAERSLQLFGFGLAAAILIDVTIVRMLLVPASMQLLGERNWWLPAWLDRLLPRVAVEHAEPTNAPVDDSGLEGPAAGAGLERTPRLGAPREPST